MDAVILAAGEGTRMRPLTRDTPKPLLPVAGTPIIDHTINQIKDVVEDIIIVAGYRKEQIEHHVADKEQVRVVEQGEPRGTGHAALQAREHVDGKTLIVMGDDLYGTGLTSMVEEERAVLAAPVDNPSRFGVFTTDNGEATGLVEKPDNPSSNLVNTGCYVVQEDFIPFLEDVEESPRGEYEITDAIHRYIEQHPVSLVETGEWQPCSYPWQLLDANEALMEHVERRIKGEIHETATVDGNVVVEKEATVKPYTVVKGPAIIKTGATVGPHAYIRGGTVIHENSVVGRSEVKNSVIRADSNIPHFNYVGDSYIGRNVNLGAGTITANLRNDDGTVKMEVKNELVETGRRKLGAVIGSNTKVGINCSIKPGRVIGFDASVDSHECVTYTVPDNGVQTNGELVDADRR